MALPTAPSRSMPQSTFDATTEAFIGALPAFETDMNALASAMTLNSTTDTSVTSNSIGLGVKTFTVSTGKSFVAGMWLSIADSAAPSTNSMICQVTSYVSGTGVLIVNSAAFYGSGTKTAWDISMSAATSSVSTSQVQDGDYIWCGTAGGTANAITLTPTPAITAYKAGRVYRFKSGASANDGATTVNVSGVGVIAVQKQGSALSGGELAANSYYELLEDGTASQLLSSEKLTISNSLFSFSPRPRFAYAPIAPVKFLRGTGALASITTAVATGVLPYSVACDPTGRFAYAPNFTDNTVSMYSINQTTGALTSIAAAVATGTGPYSVTCDPTGRFVYIANQTAATTSMYSINQTTGALTSIAAAVATGTGPRSVTCDPTGRFVYVANAGANTASMYSINQTTGALTSITAAVATGSAPYSITCDPTGRFLYVANAGADAASMYSINQTTGALTSITTAVATGVGPYSITCDPTGRFAYVANLTGNTASMYSINQTTGALTSITTAVATGSAPISVTCDPTGRFVYVANFGANTASMYSINQTTGALTSITAAIATGVVPYSVACDPTGRFVYIANSTGGSVSMYSINEYATNSGSIKGIISGDQIPSGSVGEFLTTTVTSAASVSLTTATPANVCSLSLTAGEWDVSGNLALLFGASTSQTIMLAGISVTSATLPTQAGGSGIGTDPSISDYITRVANAVTQTHALSPVRVSLTATTTIYFVTNCTFTVSTLKAYGTIRARRVG